MTPFFIGIVEDRHDPLMMGRCKVRIIGVHTDDNVILKTEDLPWAMPVTPLTSASMHGIGQTPLGPIEGTYVILTFLDGDDKQKPIMLGTVPGVPTIESSGKAFQDPNKTYPVKDKLNEPDLNRLARNQKIEKTIVQTKTKQRVVGQPLANSGDETWSQPVIPYGALYPYNHVFESEFGHVMEFDDSPGTERINITHKSGTYTEIDANGSQVNRIVGNGYEIIDKDGYVLIKGHCVINVDGSAAINIKKDAHLVTGGSINVDSTKYITVRSDAPISLETPSDIQFKCKTFKINAESLSANLSDRVDIKAKNTINMDGKKVYKESKTSAPKEHETIWSYFESGSLYEPPMIPSREEILLQQLEGMSKEEKKKFMEESGGMTPGAEATMVEIKEGDAPVVVESNEKTGTMHECGFELPITNSTQLSKNFTVGDLTPNGVKDGPTNVDKKLRRTADKITCSLKNLAENIIEPVLALYPNVKVGSCLRYTDSEKSTGVSQHCYGEAVDLHFKWASKTDLFDIAVELAKVLPFDQMILEYNGAESRWIHISYKANDKQRKKLNTTFTGGAPYLVGLRKPETKKPKK